MKEVEDETADLIIFNTCTVRENANTRLYGHLGALKKRKESGETDIIAICGCMMQQADIVEHLRKSYKFIDLMFGTFNFHKLAELLYRRYTGEEKQVVEILAAPEKTVERLPEKRKYKFKSGVNIMYGCNNFCTYCIVPYVRGRERSRTPEEILSEIEDLTHDGVIEIMLLGQNVNSYGVNFMGESEKIKANPDYGFPELLEDVCKIEGIKRVRFMTSHPKDLSDRLIEVMRDNPKICHQLHLPVQAGSSELLKKMNRRYTKEHYLGLIDKIRAAVPDISLSTDIMIGFPGETEEDIQDTMDVIRYSQYDQVFTFIYSKRTGTPAASMEQLPEDVVNERFQRVLDLVHEVTAKSSARFLCQECEVLVEELNDHTDGFVTGRMGNNILVHFPGDESLIGTIQKVKLVDAKGFYYIGELI
jgi:tRNA-2-methylthio-N6-dimethylallyladenosine synthase